MKITIKGPHGVSDVLLPPGYSLGQLKALIAQSMPHYQYGTFKLLYDGQDMNDDTIIIDWLDQQSVDLVSLNGNNTGYGGFVNNTIGSFVNNTMQRPANNAPVRMLVKKMPDDNSCLFHAIKQSIGLDLSVTNLRRIIYNTILGNPIQYTEALLGRPRKEYAVSMLEEAWGGGIELAILAKYFSHEIAVVDIQSGHVSVFAEGCGYPWRVYLLYSGIHYDCLELSNGTTKFAPDDRSALQCAQQIAADLRSQRQYTNVAEATLECEMCGVQFKGAKEAEHHAEMFGHLEFKEL